MLAGTGPPYPSSLVDRVAEPEGVASLVFGQAVVALGSGVRPSLSTTPEPADLSPVTVRVTHPFHPRFGQELEFVKRLLTWRVDRVFFFDESGVLGSLPAEWTDLALPDGFVVVAHGRVPFRTSALLELADRLVVLRSKGPAPSGESVQEITP